MAKHYTIEIENSGERYSCVEGQSLLQGMEALGRRGIPVGCRGGGCGVCKVEVVAGSYRRGKMSRACVSEAEIAAGVVLACKVFPTDDVALRVIGKMAKAVESV